MSSRPLYRFNSFAPVRQGASQVKWLVDGEQHMSEVAEAIEAAKYEILITDWQIHPNVHLKRPETGVDSLVWRLDKLLLRKASEGVKIYILLYWEQFPLRLGSDFAKSVLNKKHGNITIIRHPNWDSGLPEYLWSHHEKLVVVDRSIAFVGGIDLCFGRWDTHGHPLADNHRHHPNAKEKPAEKRPGGGQYCRWVGKDYSNTFVVGERTDYDKPLDDILDKESSAPIRTKIPRLPWHDVSCVFTGDAVGDVAKHFIERYNAIVQGLGATLLWWKSKLTEKWDHNIKHTIRNPHASNVKIQVVRSVGFADWIKQVLSLLQRMHLRWPQVDIRAARLNLLPLGIGTRPVLDSVLPKASVSLSVPSLEIDPVEDSSIHTAYLNAIENSKHSIYIENQFFISSLSSTSLFKELQESWARMSRTAARSTHEFVSALAHQVMPPFLPSVTAGTRATTQHTCSNTAAPYFSVNNEIQEALVKRITRANERNEDFHVMLVLPLKNEFQETWCSKYGSILESTAYLTYATLFRGEDSLFERLKKQDVNPDKYVSVYGLRTHDTLGEKLVTELIYVHSKVMIVDDRLTIVGSANINDRSMLGSRDSEVCVVIEDQEMLEGKMNGKTFKVGKFSHTLRCHLMNEHLGNLQRQTTARSMSLHPHDPINEECLQALEIGKIAIASSLNLYPDDPINTEFLQVVSETAANNTEIYEQVFKGKILPTDHVKGESDLQSWLDTKGLADTDPEEARKQLSRVRGNIVQFPHHFLCGYMDKDEHGAIKRSLWDFFTLRQSGSDQRGALRRSPMDFFASYLKPQGAPRSF